MCRIHLRLTWKLWNSQWRSFYLQSFLILCTLYKNMKTLGIRNEKITSFTPSFSSQSNTSLECCCCCCCYCRREQTENYLHHPGLPIYRNNQLKIRLTTQYCAASRRPPHIYIGKNFWLTKNILFGSDLQATKVSFYAAARYSWSHCQPLLLLP